jgi:hypothetical protein
MDPQGHFMSTSDHLFAQTPPDKRIVNNALFMHSDHIERNIGRASAPGDYFFSGGNSNRDFAAVKALAGRMPQSRFVLLCPQKAAEELKPYPPNLEVFVGLYGGAFLDFILGSRAVILPVVDPDLMSGQLVSIQAMLCAKPIFMNRNNFIKEWIRDLDQVRFLMQYDSLDGLRDALSALSDEEIRQRGAETRLYMLKNFTQERFYESLAHAIAGTCG